MKIEMRLKGSPADFISVIRTLLFRIEEKPGDFRHIYVFHSKDITDPNMKEVTLSIDNKAVFNSHRRRCHVRVQYIPEGNSLLLLNCPDDSWQELKNYWKLILTELERQEMIRKANSLNDEREESDEEKIRVPSRPANYKQWQKAYPILSKTRSKFQALWESGDTKSSVATNNDFRDALANEGIQRYVDKTLKDILKAGDAGLLK